MRSEDRLAGSYTGSQIKTDTLRLPLTFLSFVPFPLYSYSPPNFSSVLILTLHNLYYTVG